VDDARRIFKFQYLVKWTYLVLSVVRVWIENKNVLVLLSFLVVFFFIRLIIIVLLLLIHILMTNVDYFIVLYDAPID
jgi:prepilin signal peptidase PulO-like enzyme (type II secretory pathway)